MGLEWEQGLTAEPEHGREIPWWWDERGPGDRIPREQSDMEGCLC